MLEKIKWWVIVFTTKEELQNEYNKDKEEFSDVGGYADFFENTIYICKSLCDERKIKVLRHELTHAMMFEYNIDISEEPSEIAPTLVGNYYEEIELINKIAKRIWTNEKVMNDEHFATSVLKILNEIKEEENNE